MKPAYTLLAIPLFLIALAGCGEKDGCGCQNFGLEYQEGDFDALFPQAFSPDGDQLNDVLKPLFSEPVSANGYGLYIKSGEDVIFSTTDPNAGWDGTTGGNPAPAAEYRVFLKFYTPGGTYMDKTFRVQLYRSSNCGLPNGASAYWFADQVNGDSSLDGSSSEQICAN